MQKKDVKWLIVLHVLLAITSVGGICSKFAAKQNFMSLSFCLLYGGLLMTLFIYAIFWQQVIKHLPLALAYANKAVAVVWTFLWGYLIFGERLSPVKIAGAVIVIIGVFIFTTDTPKKEEVSNE